LRQKKTATKPQRSGLKVPEAPTKSVPVPSTSTDDELAKQEQAILHTLEKLRQQIDPGQIDWGKAGYDFGEGFKGPEDRKR
jgi:hypothetical protein